MHQMEVIKASCLKAKFIFEKDCGFTLYLDFTFDNDTTGGTFFYITDIIKVKKILDILNNNKTGFAKDSIDEDDLKGLIGLKTKILIDEYGKCYFRGFD